MHLMFVMWTVDWGVAGHSCNPVTRETEMRESQSRSEPGLCSKILSQNKAKQKTSN